VPGAIFLLRAQEVVDAASRSGAGPGHYTVFAWKDVQRGA
jgi:hypothetical protein